MEQIKLHRLFMKGVDNRLLKNLKTDALKKLPPPPMEKAYDSNATLIELPNPEGIKLTEPNLFSCIKNRKSRRRYSEDFISLSELSYLLWATQGVKKANYESKASYRTVPSGGARHPFETYLIINRVHGLTHGVYRYLPFEHKLVFMFPENNFETKVTQICLNQLFTGKSAVVFVWSCIPYRSEWKYFTDAHKAMLVELGHICQNLYLACESIECGTCAILDYNQSIADEYLQLDGNNEYVVYMATVGKI